MTKLMVVVCTILVTAIAAQAEPVMAESVMATPVPAATAVEVSPKTIWFEIGPEMLRHEYREPGLMSEKGTFYGVAGSLFGHENKLMGAIQFEYAQGKVFYDGGTQGEEGTERATYDGLRDQLAEVRAVAGPDFGSDNALTTLYMGIGYRYLKDELSSFKPGGYDRESNYLYLPLGATTKVALGSGWSIGGTGEFDLLLIGVQRSDFGDIGGTAMTNDQHTGWGVRGALSVEKKFGEVAVKVQPFIRYWEIAESDRDDTYNAFVEPQNNTTQTGVQVLFVF